MVVIKGETLRVDSKELYAELKEKDGIRDIISDGITLHIDKALLEDCVLICEEDIPDKLFEDLG
jgi:hypothetical protein